MVEDGLRGLAARYELLMLDMRRCRTSIWGLTWLGEKMYLLSNYRE